MSHITRLLVISLSLLLLTACATPGQRPSVSTEASQDDESADMGSVESESPPESGTDESGELSEPSKSPPEPTTATTGDEADEVSPALYTVDGKVNLVAGDDAVDPGDIRDIVVYFESEAPVPGPEPGTYEIRTRRKRFIPDVLVVPVGSTVAFPNDDDILHNVFSVSSNARFDLGSYGLGDSQSYTFNETGLALVHCDVHHAMQADILVVDTPYYTTVNDDGSFSLAGIPPGPGTLHIRHPRAEKIERPLTIPLEGVVDVNLDIIKPRVVRHANKTGGSYRNNSGVVTPPLEETETTSPPATSDSALSGLESAPVSPAPTEVMGGGNTLEGRLELVAEDESPDPDQHRNIVVYYEPESGYPVPQARSYEIATQNKRFSPEVLVVPVGSTVAFPNNDRLLHNVFSVSPISAFDLGRYGLGESRSYTFEEPGLALIHCDVHHHMQADVLVLDTPYYTRADGDGWFRLAGLPDGQGTLHIWHPRTSKIAEQVGLPRGGMLAHKLEVTKPRVPKHLNKLGQPYRDLWRRERQYDY